MASNFLTKLTHYVTRLYSNMMPIPCLLCGADSQHYPLCRTCIASLPYQTSVCPRCSMPTPHSQLCGNCLTKPPEHDLSFSLFNYQQPVDQLIAAFKYHDKTYLTKLFADLMFQQLQHRPLPQLLVPIPLYHRRLRERGYNQSSELAKALSRRLAIAVCHHTLIRSRDTQPQASLPFSQRKRNIHKAFKLVNHKIPPHVALIDDVLTTGYTATAAAKLLRQNGAVTIEVWTIARSIRHD